jgi:GTP-binding protein EngB required for normal cell division
VLLAKADKLNQSDRAKTLKQAAQTLGPGVGVQVFSARDGIGVQEAQKGLLRMLAKPG